MTIPSWPISAWTRIGRRHATLACLAVVAILAGCSPASPTAPASTSAFPPPTPTAATSATPAPSATAGSGLTWLYGEAGYETSVLRVPLDYAKPDSEQITIALARRPATDPAHRIGTLVFLPGGPGDSGIEPVRAWASPFFTEEVGARFDIVAFDARGNPAGLLDPKVRCPVDDPYETADFDPRTMTDLTEMAAWAKQFAAACEAGSGGILPFVGTENVIQDIDRLREALGEETLSFLGISYGTLTGLFYAERYPNRVRAMILDAPVDPALDLVTWYRNGTITDQGLLDAFLDACADDATCAFHSGGKTRQEFDGLMTRFAKGPIDGASVWEAWTSVSLGLRDPAWLATALAAARDGDTAAMRDMVEGLDDADRRGYGSALTCVDTDAPRDVDALVELFEELRPGAPDFAWMASGGLDCAFWPVETQRPAGPIRAAGAPTMLVVGSTLDPSTPYAWAESVAAELDSGALVTRDGHGHGSTFLGNACIDGITNAYLIELTVPATGTTCR